MAQFDRMAMPGRWSGQGWRIARWSAAAALLALPAIAMRFTAEVNWTGSDFVAAAILIGGALLAYELLVWLSNGPAYRLGAMVALGAGFLMTWANLAVGIIGSEDNPVNLLFQGVLLVGAVSALVARFRPAGMEHTLLIMAVLQLLLGIGTAFEGHEAPLVTVFFCTAWLFAARQFRLAARIAKAG